MIELVLLRSKACFDIPQALPVSQLSKSHTEILVEAGELLDFEVATVATDALMKNMERKMLHHLRESKCAGVQSLTLRTLLREDG